MKIILTVLAVLCAGQAVACEMADHQGHNHKDHKHPCVEKEGKPCHLHEKIHAQKFDGAINPAPMESKAAGSDATPVQTLEKP
jgi:hypothetical protein